MRKTVLNVPMYVKYISDWENYKIPHGHIIIDKGICGCGYTHWCLTNDMPVILCSPRKALLQNKFDQIDGLYYFKNEKEAIIEYDKSGLEKDEIQKNKLKAADTGDKESYIKKLKSQLRDWLIKKTTPLTSDYGVPKILVTYDSLQYVLDVVKEFKIKFQIIADEFQSIFGDATFKAEVELDFVEFLKDCPDVCYLSATPMLDKYLDQLDYFKDLPYYQLIWPNNKVETIRLERKYSKSLISDCKEIIENYKSGKRPIYIDPEGNQKESKEVVFFVNSVKTICDIIKKSGLKSDECNILCAESTYNTTKLSKLGKGFGYGRIPKLGESNKMFTFCTRTVYLGADFYSDNARTVVCSSLTIKTMILDVSLDLPQIMGRQRLDSNPWKNECLLLYTGETKKEDTEFTFEEFQEYIRIKNERSSKLINIYQECDEEEKVLYADKLVKDIKYSQYRDDYIGFSKKSPEPISNYLVQIAELRAWEISRPEYQERVLIKKEYEIVDNIVVNSNKDCFRYLDKIFRDSGSFYEKMNELCKILMNNPDILQKSYKTLSSIIPMEFMNYINLFGPERIYALGCHEVNLIKEKNNLENSKTLDPIVYSSFQEGQKYLLNDIKGTLKQIYSDNNITKTAKASDLDEYFETKRVTINNNGKRENGYLLLKKLK